VQKGQIQDRRKGTTGGLREGKIVLSWVRKGELPGIKGQKSKHLDSNQAKKGLVFIKRGAKIVVIKFTLVEQEE